MKNYILNKKEINNTCHVAKLNDVMQFCITQNYSKWFLIRIFHYVNYTMAATIDLNRYDV